MTRPSLAGIEKRVAEATPGPWEEVACLDSDGRRYNALEGPNGIDVCEVPRTPQGSTDASFIADTRTDVPALAAVVHDVLAVSREEMALALHADDIAHERAVAEWSDMDPDARDWYLDQADAALALIRRAITAHIDLTPKEKP